MTGSAAPAGRDALMPGGVNSPVRSLRAVGGGSGTVVVTGGKGARLRRADGSELVDFVMGWGSVIAGHAHPAVLEAVDRAAREGLGFGMSTETEERYAAEVCRRAGVDMVRAVSSGTEAAMTAVRLARGVTGRSLVAKFAGGYHGHSDAMLVEAGSGSMALGKPSSAGVPAGAAADTAVLVYNDAECVAELARERGSELAAVIVEPVAGNMNLVRPDPGFIGAIREGCDSCGALMVADEVMTGFRASPGLACRDLFGTEPDLVCLGKVIGGGLPAAAVCGRRELMERLSPTGDVFQAGTLAGNPVALAAGLATLELLDDEAYKALFAACQALCEGLEAAAGDAGVPFRAQAVGAMAGLYFAPEVPGALSEVEACDEGAFRSFFRGMLDRGVLLPPSRYEACFVGLGHDEGVIEDTVDAAAEAFSELSRSD